MAGKDGALFVLIIVLFSNVFLFQNLVSTWNEENNNQFSYLSIHLSEYPFDKSENPKEKLALRDLNFEVSKPNQINSSNQFCVKTDFTPTVDESPFLGNNLTAEKHLEFTIKAYASSNNILPTRFNETEKTAKPFSIMQRYKSDFIAPSKDYIYILVNSSVYSSIETSIYQFIKDLEDSGFLVELYSGSWGTPENTKHFLQNGFSSGLIGAILIGDIPTAWYEMDNPGDESFPEHEEFPIDLYYMDLDGIWNDLDGDGLYDMHNGDVTPEIWVGRLKASGFISDEASLLNNYFRKNHRYRNGGYTIPRRALVYVDDDWTPWADDDNETLEQLYSETILVKDNATTNAKDYKARLIEGYEWVHLRCHGLSKGHMFEIEDAYDDTVDYSDYFSIDPLTLFYQLFVCSGARYTEANHLGGACIFADTSGIVAIGSTKTGGMRYFDDFYGPLSEGKNIGTAFQEWYQFGDESDPKWYYGLTILGDPTLYVHAHELDVALEPPTRLNPNNSSLLEATIYNYGTKSESNVELFLMINDTIVEKKILAFLGVGESYTLNYLWAPTAYSVYNVTVYTPLLSDENIVENNQESLRILVPKLSGVKGEYINEEAVSTSEYRTSMHVGARNVDTLGYKWDFEDETIGTRLSTTHIYTKPEAYIVTLAVMDSEGTEVSDVKIASVEAIPASIRLWTLIIIVVCFGFILAISVYLVKYRASCVN